MSSEKTFLDTRGRVVVKVNRPTSQAPMLYDDSDPARHKHPELRAAIRIMLDERHSRRYTDASQQPTRTSGG